MELQPPTRDPNELEGLLAEREEELRQFRLALDVLSPIDPSTGTLNRNGVIDAIQDALDWLTRRNDPFAILAVEIPGLQSLSASAADRHQRIQQHLEAVLEAALRKVDRVGHIDHTTFAAVLREFKAEGSQILLERLRTILQMESERASLMPTDPSFTLVSIKPGPFHQAGSLLEQVEALRSRSLPGNPLIIEL